MSTSRRVIIGKFLIAERTSQLLLVQTKYCKNRHVINQESNFCGTCGVGLSIDGEFVDEYINLGGIDVTDPIDEQMVNYWTHKQIFPEQEQLQQVITGSTSVLNCFILCQDDYIDANEETIMLHKNSQEPASHEQIDWLFKMLKVQYSITIEGTIVYHC